MRTHGFTLIEMLVTLALLAILASVVIPFAQLQGRHSQEAELRESLRQIRTALDAYKAAADSGKIHVSSDASGYPPDLATLVNGVPDAHSPAGGKIFFLRRIPRDPLQTDESVPDEKTWGLRSYASPPDAPAAGRDVYDVHSLSSATGLNGIPYRQW